MNKQELETYIAECQATSDSLQQSIEEANDEIRSLEVNIECLEGDQTYYDDEVLKASSKLAFLNGELYTELDRLKHGRDTFGTPLNWQEADSLQALNSEIIKLENRIRQYERTI